MGIVLTAAFFDDQTKHADVSLDGAPNAFTTVLVDHLHQGNRADLLQLLTFIQDDHGGDLAVALRPYVEALTQATTPAPYRVVRPSNTRVQPPRAKMPDPVPVIAPPVQVETSSAEIDAPNTDAQPKHMVTLERAMKLNNSAPS